MATERSDGREQLQRAGVEALAEEAWLVCGPCSHGGREASLCLECLLGPTGSPPSPEEAAPCAA